IGGPHRPVRSRPRNMEAQHLQTADEITRLQRCINDLVSLLALPAIWTGRPSSSVASTLLETLVGMLRLDWVYLRTSERLEGSTIEWARAADLPGETIDAHRLGQALDPWLIDDRVADRVTIPNPVGDGDVSIVTLRLGVRDDVGIFVAGSRRADFPTEIEQLLLQVATNQAVTGLHEAHDVSERRLVTERLEQRVMERTGELAAVNHELRQEILERRSTERELKLLVDLVPQCFGALDVDGTLRHVSRYALAYLGCGLEDLTGIGPALARFYHPEDLTTAQNMIQRMLAQGGSCEFEARLRRHDGVYRWLLIRYEPVHDEQGQIVRWYGTGTDIDDRKRAEERVREENLALREEVDKASMFEEI